MSSIESNHLSISKRVNEENFILAEYVKRNFEQYADINDVKWVVENWNYPLINKSDELYKIQNYIRHYLIQCENIKKNIKTVEFFDFTDVFDRVKLKAWIDFAYNLSVKYGLSISDILFPYDMELLIKMVVNDSIDYYPTIFFNNDIQQHNSGYITNYDFSSKVISFHIKLDEDLLDIEKVTCSMSACITLMRDHLGHAVSKFERNMLDKFSSMDNSNNYRSSQIFSYSRFIGLFAWDMKKIKNWSIDDVMNYLHNNRLVLRKNKNRLKYNLCSKKCELCDDIVSCRKYFADCYRFASLSIEKNKIVPTSADGSVKKTDFSENKFDRVRYDRE